VLVLGTYRDTEPGAAALAGIAAERRLVLRGLAVADLAGALAEATGEAVAPDTVAVLHRRTGGNPFFAAEIVRLRRAEGSAAVPVSVRAVLDRRIDRLPPGAQAVLQAAAVLDPAATAGVDTVLLAGVTGVAPVAVPELLAPAVEAGLVDAAIPGAGRYRLAHALVADTLAARTPATQRLALHRAAASLLGRRADAGVGDAAEVAHQQLAAARLSGEPDEARAAAQRCVAAARTAVEQTAYEDAVGRLRDALAVLAGVPGGPDRDALLCALGEATLAAGDPAGARRAFAEAAAHARRHRKPELLAAAALGLTGGAAGFEVDLGDPDRVEPLEQALAALPDADSALRSTVAARLSVALAFTAGEPRRRDLADTAVAMARRIGDPRALAVALAARCDALAGPDHVSARHRMAEEIVTAARTAGDRTLELLGRRMQVVALAEAGRWRQVDLAVDAYARVAEPLRLPGLTWYVPLWRGARATMRGDRAAEDEHGRQLRHRVERSGSGNAELLALTQRFVREVLAAPDGEVRLDGDFDSGLARFVQLSPDVAAAAAQGTTALLHALEGKADARALLHAFLAARVGDPADSEWLPERVQGAMTAVLLGDRAAAEALYGTLAPYSGLFAIEGILAGTWGSVDAHLGRLARLLGRTAAACRHLGEAAELDAGAGAALGARTARWVAEEPGPGTVARDDGPRGTVAADEQVPDEAMFRCDGEVWTLAYAGRAVRLRDAKGLRDLAALLARPGRELAVHELVGSPVPGAGGIEAADRTAIAAYRRRLADLEEERAEAASMHDPVRAERTIAERDALLRELGAVTGLGGHPRRDGSDAERMRKAVGNRIRLALGRIEEVHPELGRHLRVSVRTGTFCRYDPDRTVRWLL
jgi:hypothetical protein